MIDTLRIHPEIGVATSIGGFIAPFMDWLSAALQFGCLCLGFAIGVVTLILKIKEYRNGSS